MEREKRTVKIIYFYDPDTSILTREQRHDMLLEFERKVDMGLETGEYSQEEAWDMYFGLLDECDTSGFDEDRKRIMAKIDIYKYNPLCSKNPAIVLLARMWLLSVEDDN